MRVGQREWSLGRRAWPVLLIALATLVGCPRNDNFPTGLNLVVPPTPNTFAVSYTGFDANVGYKYDLSWTINDPSGVVDHYRLYLLGAGPAPELLTETDQPFYPAAFPYLITGLRLGVSAVSTGHVEGEMQVTTVE